MSEMMYKDGFDEIINIDISNTVINKMNENYKEGYDKMKCKNQII